jgi:hypothetical protein
MYRFTTPEYLNAVVARNLCVYIDDWTDWTPATVWLQGPCAVHGETGGTCGTAAGRWQEFMKLIGVLEPFRIGGALAHGPYVREGRDGRHIVGLKENENGWCYVVGTAGDLDATFANKDFRSSYSPPPYEKPKYK